MDKTYNNKIVEGLKVRLKSISRIVEKFERIDINLDDIDMPNDLLHIAISILTHAETEIGDIYDTLYRFRIEQINKKVEE